MDHRRDNHDMPMCYFDMENRCTQLPGKCWYKHRSSETSDSKINKCFPCQQTFNSIGIMMEHRKTMYPETVKVCTKSLTGECRRVVCWFLHNEQVFLLSEEIEINP